MLKPKIIKSIVNITLGSFLIIIFYSISYGHSGRTNSEGCHKDNKNKSYHCHNSKQQSKTKKQYDNFKVVDGDTIHFANKKYRFSGIDAPELKQKCEYKGEVIYCGVLATDILKQKISNKQVKCIDEGKDRYNRIIGECFVNDESLSSFMVRNGYAFAYRKYSSKFIEDENFAKKNNLGLWKMKFSYPWDYRRSGKN